VSARSSTPLRLGLTFNLLFSSGCAAASLAQALGGWPTWVISLLGVGLAGFVGLIGYSLWRLRIGLALLISALDGLWVVITLPLIAVPGLLSGAGAMIVAGVAGMVGLAGLLQLRGIKAMLRVEDGEQNVFRHCVNLKSRLDATSLWTIVKDLDSISLYSPSLVSSSVEVGDRTDPEPGAVRVCTNTNGQCWSEEVVEIDDEARSLVLRFRTEAEDFPFPFDEMSGGWIVAPAPDGGSNVQVWWRVRPRQKRLGWLFLAVASIPLDQDMQNVVAAMESGVRGASVRTGTGLPSLSYC